MLGGCQRGEVQLDLPYCGGCGKLAASIRWMTEVRAVLSQVDDYVGSVGDPHPDVYRTPVEEVINHLQDGEDHWRVEVSCFCSGCSRTWKARILGSQDQQEQEPEPEEPAGVTEHGDPVVSPDGMPESRGYQGRL